MFADPATTIARFGLHENDYVVDFGAGSGAYSLAAAAAAARGKVYAVDIQKDMLARLKREAQAAGLHHVEVVWADLEVPGDLRLRENSCDAVILSNVLFQSGNKRMLAAEARRILKPGGRALVVEWSGSYNGVGPRESDVVSADAVRELFRSHAFAFLEEIEAGAYHYGFIFRK